MEPQIRYVRSADGTNIACTVMGEGVPMIFAPNIWCHLGLQMSGEFSEAWQQMADEGIMVVPYDMRGMGMSDRDVEDFSLDSQMADIEALRAHLGFDRFALYGNVFGSLVAIAYAASHPEQVTHLVLSLPFANGDEWYRAMPTLQGLESFRAMGDEQWEIYTLTHATALAGTNRGVDPQRLAALMRECTTPDTLRRYFSDLQTQDVTTLLAKVGSPTLVLAVRERQPFFVQGRFAREVAAGIPGARLAIREGFVAPGLPGTKLALEFILGRAVQPSPPALRADPSPVLGERGGMSPATGMTAILFADIADSTALTERLGDAAFRDKARRLDSALRSAIREHSGTAIEGKLLGDGVLATFTSAREAIEAALRERGQPRGLRSARTAGN